MLYTILIKTELSNDMLMYLDDLRQNPIEVDQESYVQLQGDQLDQSSLLRCLKQLNNWGIELIAVNRMKEY